MRAFPAASGKRPLRTNSGRVVGRRRRARLRLVAVVSAAALHLSVPTVKAHVSRLLDKLDVDNRVQIALLVQALSLIHI